MLSADEFNLPRQMRVSRFQFCEGVGEELGEKLEAALDVLVPIAIG